MALKLFENTIVVVSLLILIFSVHIHNLDWVEATPKDAHQKVQYLTYNDPVYGVKIQYPSNWTIDKTQISLYDDLTKIVGFANDPDALSGYFLISVHDLSDKHSNQTVGLTELLNRTIEYYEQYYYDFNLIESDYNSSLNNPPNGAYKLTWIDKDGPYTIKSLQIGTILGNKIYLVRYYAELGNYSDNLQLIERMISSLEISNRTSRF